MLREEKERWHLFSGLCMFLLLSYMWMPQGTFLTTNCPDVKTSEVKKNPTDLCIVHKKL